LGKLIEPLFAPLGFDWRICVGLIGAMAAREVFVATLGQIFATGESGDLVSATHSAVFTSGPHHGELVFTAPTIMALLVFFAYALQCMSTIATLRRETNSWRWPLTAWGYMFVLAWVAAFAARHITMWLTG
jgi:ferrous iron transport protein B